MTELRTLIDLCPGTRLPQYEAEIFSDLALTDYYLCKLCEQYDWYSHYASCTYRTYRYARYVMKCRWPEAEAVIATDPLWACNYARYVVKSRWPEAEPVIAASDYREWYNNQFGTNI